MTNHKLQAIVWQRMAEQSYKMYKHYAGQSVCQSPSTREHYRTLAAHDYAVARRYLFKLLEGKDNDCMDDCRHW